MTTLKRLCFTLCFVFCFVLGLGLSASAQEQQRTPAVEINAGGGRAQFTARGEIQQMRVEVYAPSGEKIFEGGAAHGQGVEWNLRDAQGRKVGAGVYLAAVTITDAAGAEHRRTEQVMVGGAARGKEAAATTAAPEGPTATTTGSGTAGKLAKFTAATVLGDSVVTENAARIGINVAPPTANLHVNGLQPAPLTTNGTNAGTLLQTSGGKGGNTTGSGTKGGKGASISLLAGNGGNAPSSSSNGNGGNITLQPGSPGAGAGLAGTPGTVLIAPTAGEVLIGTEVTQSSKVGIVADAGFYSSGKISLSTVLQVENTCLGGFPGCGSAIRVNNDEGTAIWASSESDWAIRASSVSSAAIFAISTSGYGVWGRSDTSIGVHGTSDSNSGVLGSSTSGEGVLGISTGDAGVYGKSTSGNGVHGNSTNKYGVFGESTNSDGVRGKSGKNGVFGEATGSGTGVSGVGGTGKGVYGQSTSNSGVFGFSGTGDGVTGQSSSGYAGNFLGKSRFTGNMEINGNELFGATTRQMINLYNQTYGIGVQTATFYLRTDGGFNWYKGGVHNNTANSPGTGGTSLMRLDASGNLFVKGAVTATNISNPSDRALKANFSAVNPRAVLDRLAAIPVQTWNYRSEGAGVRHMGPMAQDFRSAFNLGTDDKTISTVDTAGVTMAAVQGLYQLSLEKDKKIEQLGDEARELRREASELRSEVEDLRARLLRLEEAIKGRQQ